MQFWLATTGVGALQGAGHLPADGDSLAAMAVFADEVPGLTRRRMAGKAVAAKTVVDLGKAAGADSGLLAIDLQLEKLPIAGGRAEAGLCSSNQLDW